MSADKKAARPTGKRFSSVEEFLKKEGTSEEVSSRLAELSKETRLVQMLVEARREAGLTQQQIAEKLGVTQGAISKLESSQDIELTLDEIRQYAGALKQRFMLTVGKPMNHVEAVKWHASGIKEHLSALARLAHDNGEMEQAIQAFFSEAFFNILSILEKCQADMPSKEPEIRLRRVGRPAKKPSGSRAAAGESISA